MKITYRWMQEFTHARRAAAELAARLTLAGLEVESVSAVAPPFSGVVVGEVLECGRHPDAEKLSLCQVTTDGANRLQIVCGASQRAGGPARGGRQGRRQAAGRRAHQAGETARSGIQRHAVLGARTGPRQLSMTASWSSTLALPLNQDLRQALDLDD